MTFLQKKLHIFFENKVPLRIPENGRKLVAEYLPWVNMVLGVFGLLSAWWLYRAANQVTQIFNADINGNFYDQIYSSETGVSLGVVFWVSLGALIVTSVMMLASIPGLRERSLVKGWNLAFWAAIVNFLYGLFYLFSGIDGAFGQFIWTLVTTTLGLYVLFQVRSLYKDSK